MRALDLLFPLRCASCGAGERILCAACRASLQPIGPPLCARCGTPTAWPVERCADCSGRRLAFRTARSAVAYDHVARTFVLAWKERGLRALAHEAVALVLEAIPPPLAADAVTFVPGDAARTRWRGVNTAEALARALARSWELPVACSLERRGRSERQRGLSRSARRSNVHGAFRATGTPPKRLVLVDDVYTTGATANAAASALRRSGTRSVDVVTFARTLRLGA